MNINTSSEQPDAEPGSTTDLHPREQLDQLFLRVESRLQHVMRKHRRLSPTLFTVSPEGLSIYAPGPLNEVPKKTVSRLTRGSSAPPKALSLPSWPSRRGPSKPNPENSWILTPVLLSHLCVKNTSAFAGKPSAASTSRNWCPFCATIVADSPAWARPKPCLPNQPPAGSQICCRR